MPRLTAEVTLSHPDLLGAGIAARLRALHQADQAALAQAAQVATSESRKGFKYRRDIVPPRKGRAATGGQMRSHLTWRVLRDGVEFDLAAADRGARHWIIQELGTGPRSKVILRKHDAANPVGRPGAGASHIRSVPSQVGRRLAGGLVFASNGVYTPTGQGTREQIHFASTVSGVPMPGKLRQGAPRIRIGKEIPAQHMVQRGGETGFRQYETNLLAAARRVLSKP